MGDGLQFDQPTEVGVVVAETARELEPLTARHRVEVRGAIRHFALTDPVRLRQILEHLVENAVKYAPPDTTISLDWRMAEGAIRVSVSDEGPGIPEEWRERIFEPYARRETRTARGSGIGLYAARRLAESVGGRLWCEPANGQGARFVLSLPAAAAVRRQCRVAHSGSSSSTMTRRWSARSRRSSGPRATR